MVPGILLYKKNHNIQTGPAFAGRRLYGAAVILGILCLIFFLLRPLTASADSWEDSGETPGDYHTVTVTVENGSIKGDPYENLATMVVTEKGKYRISLSWLPEGVSVEEFHQYNKDAASGKNVSLKNTPGFLTVLTLIGDDGRVYYSTNAGTITIDTVMNLEPGEYTVRALFAANTSEYEAIAREYLCSEREVAVWTAESGVDTVAKDGTYRMVYDTSIKNERANNTKYQVGLYVGFGVGLVIAAVILCLMAYFSNKENRVGKPKYDERQLLARGKAATYSFFTLLCLIMFLAMADAFGILGDFFNNNTSYFYLAAGMIGISVYAFFCVKNDAYIALNERAGVVTMFLVLIGLYNAFIFCIDLIPGKLLTNGVLSIRTANGIAAACTFFIVAVLLVKKIISSSKKDQDDEEEEDDE